MFWKRTDEVIENADETIVKHRLMKVMSSVDRLILHIFYADVNGAGRGINGGGYDSVANIFCSTATIISDAAQSPPWSKNTLSYQSGVDSVRGLSAVPPF